MSFPLSQVLHVTEDCTYLHYCPGCKRRHFLPSKHANGQGKRWLLTGTNEAPTFTPGVELLRGAYSDNGDPNEIECAYFITAGQIQFGPQCSHALAGQTVPMPDFQ